jgi:hypothetical protein
MGRRLLRRTKNARPRPRRPRSATARAAARIGTAHRPSRVDRRGAVALSLAAASEIEAACAALVSVRSRLTATEGTSWATCATVGWAPANTATLRSPFPSSSRDRSGWPEAAWEAFVAAASASRTRVSPTPRRRPLSTRSPSPASLRAELASPPAALETTGASCEDRGVEGVAVGSERLSSAPRTGTGGAAAGPGPTETGACGADPGDGWLASARPDGPDEVPEAGSLELTPPSGTFAPASATEAEPEAGSEAGSGSADDAAVPSPDETEAPADSPVESPGCDAGAASGEP